MNPRQQRTAPEMPFRVLSALLASWIFILSLAGVSPALHSWLHADSSSCAHECEPHSDDAPDNTNGHYCGVIALQGTLDTVAIIDLPVRSAFQHLDFVALVQEVTEQELQQPFQARAPPLKS